MNGLDDLRGMTNFLAVWQPVDISLDTLFQGGP